MNRSLFKPLWLKVLLAFVSLAILTAVIGSMVISGQYSVDASPGPGGREFASFFPGVRKAVAAYVQTGQRPVLFKTKSSGDTRAWISLYAAGVPGVGKAFPRAPYLAQSTGHGSDYRRAVDRALAGLLALPAVSRLTNLTAEKKNAFLRRLRIKIDFLTGEAPVASLHPMVENLSFLYGIDGVCFTRGRETVRILPSEIVEVGISEVVRGQLRVGLDLKAVRHYGRMKSRRLLHGWTVSRFRTVAMIECGLEKTPKPVYRGNILYRESDITRETVRRGLLSAVSNLHSSLDEKGQFLYLYYPIPDRIGREAYSFPRHAGALWMIYRGQSVLSNGAQIRDADRSLEWFLMRTGMVFLPQRLSGVNLYDTAIGLLAVLERRRVTGATDYDRMARRMADAIIRMQDRRGMFHLRYPFRPGLAPKKSLPYAPGEAMLALGQAYRVFRKPAYKAAVIRGMRFITERVWSFFGSRLFYGFFAWEMQVLAENHRWLPGMSRFSFDQADSYLNYQYMTTRPETRDLLGAFHETVLRVPKAAHSGSRGEGIVASRRLAAALGIKDLERKYRDSLRKSVVFILNNQVRRENSWYYPRVEKAIGAIRYMPSFHELRIDHTQHCAAVLQAAYEDRLFP